MAKTESHIDKQVDNIMVLINGYKHGEQNTIISMLIARIQSERQAKLESHRQELQKMEEQYSDLQEIFNLVAA